MDHGADSLRLLPFDAQLLLVAEVFRVVFEGARVEPQAIREAAKEVRVPRNLVARAEAGTRSTRRKSKQIAELDTVSQQGETRRGAVGGGGQWDTSCCFLLRWQ